MSTTIDQKVVEMRFDNGQFESGVASTMSSITRLKHSLNFDDSARNVSLKFSAMYSYADQTMRNIANSVNYYAKKIASSLTIDPIMSGFNEYETKINSIQTIMSNTASKGTTMEDVVRVIDDLNTYADKTIYNFAEMTRNIGTFTAAGVGLEDASKAIQGIANLAAVSGSTSQQASTAMYQLSQAMASGTVKLMDWNSVVNAGMGGQVFQDALKETAKMHGVAIDDIIKKEGSFRESLSRGWLTSEILTETLSKMTKTGAAEYLAKLTGVEQDQIEAAQKLVANNKDGSASYEELAEELSKTGKITKEKAIDILKLADNAEDAATKVKTFTQLWSTLAESAQSGWSKTWEIIIGDFEEAKEALTQVSDTIGGMINASADARNEMLENWKVLGGRKALLDGIVNAFHGVMNILKPIKEAFREIFPRTTSEQLVKITENFRDFTETFRKKFEEGSEAADKLKRTFKGLFALIDIGVMAFKAIGKGLLALVDIFVPVGDGILGMTASLGDGIVSLRDYIKTTDIFNKAVSKVVGVLKKVITGIIEVFRGLGNFSFNMITGFVERVALRWGSLADIAESIKKGFQSVGNFIKGVFSVVGPILKTLKDMLLEMFKGIGEAFRNAEFSDVIDILNGLLTGGLIVGVKKLLDLISVVKENGFIGLFGGKTMEKFIKSINKILDGVAGAFKAFTQSIQADVLMKIAKAIGILALSLFGLSLIDSDKLAMALGAITVLFTELFGSMALFSKVMGNGASKTETTGKGLVKFKEALKVDLKNPLLEMTGVMIGVSVAILLLSGALTKIAKLKPEEMLVGLTGVMVLLAGVTMSMTYLAKSDKQNAVAKGTKRLIAIGTAIRVMASAMVDIAALSWEQLAKGIIGFGVCVVALVAVMKSMPEKIPTGALSAMIGASITLLIISKAIEKIGSIEWGVLGKGLIGMTASFALIVGSFVLMDKFKHSITNGSSAMLITSIALLTLIPALLIIGAMKWENLAKGMVTFAVILGTMAGAFAIMDKMSGSAIKSAAAIIVMSLALSTFIPTLLLIGAMPVSVIAKGLITMAAAFVVLGVAGYALSGVAPTLVMLGAAIALIGVGVLAAGVGLIAFAAGLTALSAAIVVFAGAVGTAGWVITELVSAIIVGLIEGFGNGIVAFCKVISRSASAIGEALKTLVLELCDTLITCAPNIAETILKVLVMLLDSLVTYTPKIVDSLFDFIIGVLDKVAERTPELIKSIAKVIAAVFEGVVDAISNLDGGSMIKGIGNIGLLAGVIAALAIIAPMIPMAMKGAIGMGLVAAELALVFAALGKLADLGDIEWFIERGGDLLGSIASVFGKIIGGFAGGIAEGISKALPGIADSLSGFATRLQPFIKTVSSIDDGFLSGVMSLVGAILAITATSIIQNITRFLGGGTAGIAKFAIQLPILGLGLKMFSNSVEGIDKEAVATATDAAKSLAAMADTIPNQGGLVAWFTGDNSVAGFGAQLPMLGMGLKAFSDSVNGINPDNIIVAADAAKSLAAMAETIPNQGGIVAWFTGDNSVARFAVQLPILGMGLKAFSDSISGMNPDNVSTAVTAANSLVALTESIPNQNGLVAWFTGDNSAATFGRQLPVLGRGLKAFSDSVAGIMPDNITSAANAGKALTEMLSTIPNEGGMVAWFTGDNSVAKFALELPILGRGLKTFSDSVAGIMPDNIISASNAAKSLADMANVVPNEGGMVAWFKGDNSIATFAMQLPVLGLGLKLFSDSVMGIIPENVTAAASAAKSLAEMATVIPNQGGMVTWFAGDNSVSKFGSELVMLGIGMRGFAGAVAGIVPENVTAAAEAASHLADLVKVIPEEGGIKAWFTGDQSVVSFATDLPVLGVCLKMFSDSVVGINPENVSAAANAAKSLAEMANVIPKEGGIKAWFTGETSIANFADKLPALGEGLIKFSNSVQGINPENVTAAADAAKSISEMLDNAPANPSDVTKLGKNIVTLSEKMKTYYANMSSISDESISLAGKALTAVKDISGISADNIKAVASAIKDLTKAIKDMAKDIKSDLKNAGKEAIEEFINGIKNNTSKAENACKTMVSNCAEKIKDESGSFKTAGKYVVQGFCDGINKNTYKAEAEAKAMAKAAYKAAKKELRVNSPSKEFRDLGTSIPEGMAVGIDKLTRVVVASSTSMSDDAIRGASNSIARIADIIGSDIDSQPTIRPILDLDEVRAGASAIANMFNSKASIDMIGNVRAINSMMNNRNQNGDNVVSAIDKLRKDIGNMDRNTYQINGVSYNEGSDVAEAIQTIVNALRIEGRT